MAAVSVIAIAGSDPSGGAGVQADLRVFSALGIAGLSAVTALTVQNSQGIQAVHPIEPGALTAQLDALFSDRIPEAVKIGMLGGEPQVKAVAAVLRAHRPPHIVLDPILASSSGTPLIDPPGFRALTTDLMPLCDLVTPNLAEAARLTGLNVESTQDMRAAGEKLLAMGAKAALVTGGHLAGTPTDVLVTKPERAIVVQEFRRMRVHTEHTHGTGCFLSSAIAAYLAFGASLVEAADIAGALLNTALRSPVISGKGRGYPDVSAAIRRKQMD
ncbi:MAG TPA: bifunctional hydroxymethylpyrimidine kinase/phosphomethylpyrimidine kinase [Capsulimonadaceae bacterium]|nr:bifunctional hydroxymethylpyrimidine kinase/phosphomethylpyrimidine kinase [Capsulimonadaceae bacterium]